MKKQLIIAGVGAILVFTLFYFGKTVPKKELFSNAPKKYIKAFNINALIAEYKTKLPPSQLTYLSSIENKVTRGECSCTANKAKFLS